MRSKGVFVYKRLDDAEERLRSAKWLTISMAQLYRKNPDSVLLEHQKDMLRHAVCKVTEAETGKSESKNGSGKHGTRYCSETVWLDRKGLKKLVHHEHVIPNRNIVHALLTRDQSELSEILDMAVGCVVYQDEHPRKVGDIDDLDGWKRYKAKGIRVVDMALTEASDIPIFVEETL